MKNKVSYKHIAVIVSILLLCPSYRILAASVSSILSNRTELTELNLNDAIIRLTLTGETFKSGITAANFQLNNEPGGTAIKSIVLINSSTVDLTLGHTGQDFDADVSNFSIKTLKSGLSSGAADLTTQTI